MKKVLNYFLIKIDLGRVFNLAEKLGFQRGVESSSHRRLSELQKNLGIKMAFVIFDVKTFKPIDSPKNKN